MWHLVEGLSKIHDDHICLSVTPVLSSIQVTKHVMKELKRLDFARPLTTEAMLAVNKSVCKGKMHLDVADYYYMLENLAIYSS